MSRFALIILAVALFCVAVSRDAFDRWVDATEIPPLAIETSVEVLDRNGHLLRAYTVADGRWRLDVTLDQIDPSYVEMLVTYEDKRFYEHPGVDLIAAARAAGQAIVNRRIVSGASTLTMQVARLLEDGPTGTWRGKLRQIRLALALERHLSKRQILELYMNRAPFGGNLEGVRAATRAYFGKEPRRLTTAESALLVALPQSPERRRPDRYRGYAIDARERVLDRMLSFHVVDPETVQAALTERMPDVRNNFPDLAAHLADRLTQNNPAVTAHRTTLDSHFQGRLETVTARAAKDAGQRLSIALLVANHQSGEILASVGSSGFQADDRQGFVDMTRAIRSPGSTLKPLVYGLAFDQGLAHPETLIDDNPTVFGRYAPENFDGLFRGTLRVREALKLSLNIPVVKLTEAITPARLLAHLRRAGVSAKLPAGKPGLAVSLGGIGVSLEHLVQLYASIANGGAETILSAESETKTDTPRTVLSPEAAWMIGDILSEIPPPIGAARTGLAYKTGTSYGHRDAWAIGYDGTHVIGVWMGRPDGTAVPGAFGGELAAPVLFEAFAILKPEIDRLPPPPPSTLLVSHSQLPQPLKRFRPRGIATDDTAPSLAFPPNGARMTAMEQGLTVKVSDGLPPFTWLADGMPIVTKTHDRAALLDLPGKGFVTLSVIDAEGRSARSTIRLD